MLLSKMLEEYPNDEAAADVSLDGLSPFEGRQCPICQKMFVSQKGLQQHSIVHTDRKPFACEVCGKSFRFKSNLFEHRSVHSGEKPFACPFCGKECRLKGNLKKHMKTHSKEQEEIDQAYEAAVGNCELSRAMCVKNEEFGDESALVGSCIDSPYIVQMHRSRRRRKSTAHKLASAPGVALFVTVGDENHEPEEQYEEAPPLYHPLTEMLGKEYSMAEFCKAARSIPFEAYQCRLCHLSFRSRFEMKVHCEEVHEMSRHLSSGMNNGVDGVFWCEACLSAFTDRPAYDLHCSFHDRIRGMIARQELVLNEPAASLF